MFDEWCLRIFDDFMRRYQLHDGYKSGPTPGSVCISPVPARGAAGSGDHQADVRILYAFESPNFRHSRQWDATFLNRFDAVLTYWNRVCSWPAVIPTPQVNHPATEADCLENTSVGRTVGIVLENRAFEGAFVACGVRLNCLDHLRAKYAYGLARLGVPVVAYGRLGGARGVARRLRRVRTLQRAPASAASANRRSP